MPKSVLAITSKNPKETYYESSSGTMYAGGPTEYIEGTKVFAEVKDPKWKGLF